MPLKNGLYKASFGTQFGLGSGVVYLKDGQIFGGDSGMFYRGTYNDSNSDFSAEIRVGRHSNQLESLFGENEFWIRLQGTSDGDQLRASGESPQAKDLVFECHLDLLAE